jgi:hypothetical protein
LIDNPRLWQSLVDAWRRSDWHDCMVTVRLMVERYPDHVATRFMLASLYLKVGNPSLAQLQYEKLLVLAVGQRQLFRAVAAQRQLDQLAAHGSHAKRYSAMQQWFRSVAPSRRRAQGGTPAVFGPERLLALPAADFTRVAESTRVDTLALDPQIRAVALDVLEVVVYGRIKWRIEEGGERDGFEGMAGENEVIVPPPGTHPDARIVLLPEMPSEILRFEPSLARALFDSEAVEPPTAASPAAEPVAPAEPAPGPAPAPATATAPAAAPRPTPDPRAEPLRALKPPPPRRRETRASVSFASRVARIGLAGTAVAPLEGWLLELSPAGIGLGFPLATLRQHRAELEAMVMIVDLDLDGKEEPLHLASKVSAIDFDPAATLAGQPGLARVVMDFALLTAPDRARIQGALIESARTGAGVAPPSTRGPAQVDPTGALDPKHEPPARAAA